MLLDHREDALVCWTAIRPQAFPIRGRRFSFTKKRKKKKQKKHK